MTLLNNNHATESQREVASQLKEHLRHFSTQNLNLKGKPKGLTVHYELWVSENPDADAPCVSINLSASQPELKREDINEFVEWLKTNTDFNHPIRHKGSTIKVLFRGDLAEDYGNQDNSEVSKTPLTVEEIVGVAPQVPQRMRRTNPYDLLK